MNAKQAIDKIVKLLNLEFGSNEQEFDFATTKLVDGTEVTNNMDEEFKIGQELYVVNEATLSPAPEGRHETREGLMLVVDSSSIIIAMEQKTDEAPANEEGESEVEVEVESGKDMKMSEATLADGTKIMSEGDKFEVGQKLFVVKEDGETVEAPEGEHTTESGIVITVDGEGTITGVKYPDEEGEGSLEASQDFSSLVEVLEPLINEVKSLSAELSQMKEKMSADYSALKGDFESFKKSPEKFSVVEKKTYKDSIDDYKLDIIKSLRK